MLVHDLTKYTAKGLIGADQITMTINLVSNLIEKINKSNVYIH